MKFNTKGRKVRRSLESLEHGLTALLDAQVSPIQIRELSDPLFLTFMATGLVHSYVDQLFRSSQTCSQ